MLQPSRSRLGRAFSVGLRPGNASKDPRVGTEGWQDDRVGGGIEDSKIFRGYYAPCYTESFSRKNDARGR